MRALEVTYVAYVILGWAELIARSRSSAPVLQFHAALGHPAALHAPLAPPAAAAARLCSRLLSALLSVAPSCFLELLRPALELLPRGCFRLISSKWQNLHLDPV